MSLNGDLNHLPDTPPKLRPRKWLRIGGLGRIIQMPYVIERRLRDLAARG